MKRTGKHSPASERRHQLVLGDHVVVNDRAPRNFRGRDGFITEVDPGKPEYRVEFDDGRQPTTGYLMAPWLEPVTS
jgi:hypothetical protein